MDSVSYPFVPNINNQEINYLSKPADTTNQDNSLMDGPATLQNILSPHSAIKKVTGEVDANELISFTESLLTSFNSLKTEDNEFEFTYQGHRYELSNNDNHVLILKDDKGEVLARFEQFSLAKLRSRVTLLRLFQQLDSNAQATFLPLFDLKRIGRINDKSPIVSGDLDGSTARQIVLGIQAGRIQITTEGMTLLVKIMQAEADVLYAINSIRKGPINEETAKKIVQIILQGGDVITEENKNLFNSKSTAIEKLFVIQSVVEQVLFSGFQANEDIQNTMEELEAQLSFEIGHTPYISIGDGAHDRFSNHKDFDRFIREIMKYYGAIFILGNHDVYWKNEFDSQVNPDFIWAFGCFAKDSATAEEWEKHQNTVFVHVYYHVLTNILYLHHGLGKLQIENETRSIATAFGLYHLPKEDKKFDPINFVDTINKRPRPRPDALINDKNDKVENCKWFSEFTEFRHKHEIIKETANEIEVNIGHGHDGEIYPTANNNIEDHHQKAGLYHVIGLNPRKDKLYTVFAAQIGELDSTTNITTTNNKKHKYEDSFSSDSTQENVKKRHIEVTENK
jgi:hypothetical protein